MQRCGRRHARCAFCRAHFFSVRVGHYPRTIAQPENFRLGKRHRFRVALRDACFSQQQCAIPSPKIQVNTTDGDQFNVYAKEVDFGSLSLTWLVLSFSLLSALFQGLRPFMSTFEKCFRPCFCCCECCNLDRAPLQRPGSMYLTEDVMRGVNSSRFVEYSASATVMILAIAFVLNVNAYETVVALAALTACCQLSGLVAELLLERSERGYKTELFPAAWLLHGIGWLQMGATFWLVLLRFQQSVAEADAGNGVAPPFCLWHCVRPACVLFHVWLRAAWRFRAPHVLRQASGQRQTERRMLLGAQVLQLPRPRMC